MPKNGSLTQTVQTATALALQVIGPNPSRNYLCIQNTGANDLTFGYDATITQGHGTTLSPGGLGAQGGFFIWDGTGYVPTNPIYVISASGSTIVILEG